jgi:hypothetical protein
MIVLLFSTLCKMPTVPHALPTTAQYVRKVSKSEGKLCEPTLLTLLCVIEGGCHDLATCFNSFRFIRTMLFRLIDSTEGR